MGDSSEIFPSEGLASAVRTMVQSHKRTRRYANLRFLLGEVCDD